MAEDSSGVTIRNRCLPPEEVIFGTSRVMDEVRKKLERVACTDVPVLVKGEAGSGKEVLARLIHRRYPGETTPFHKVTSLGRGGWRKSASIALPGEEASGDVQCRHAVPGRLACVGSLFFDEVAEFNSASQRRLTRLLHDNQPLGIGGAEYGSCLLRVICSTKHDIEREMSIGNFREDLFYSINVVCLLLPALRERREDIPGLVRYFWTCYEEEFGSGTHEPSSQLIEVFGEYGWPGNIRELANWMKRYVLLGSEEQIVDELTARTHQSLEREPPSGRSVSLKSLARQEAQELERKIILKTLRETQWNRSQAARVLNVSYRTLLYKIKEAGVSPKRLACKREEQS